MGETTGLTRTLAGHASSDVPRARRVRGMAWLVTLWWGLGFEVVFSLVFRGVGGALAH